MKKSDLCKNINLNSSLTLSRFTVFACSSKYQFPVKFTVGTKLKILKNYDKWFFVVTDRNKIKVYKRFGDAVDLRYLKSKIKLFLR